MDMSRIAQVDANKPIYLVHDEAHISVLKILDECALRTYAIVIVSINKQSISTFYSFKNIFCYDWSFFRKFFDQ